VALSSHSPGGSTLLDAFRWLIDCVVDQFVVLDERVTDDLRLRAQREQRDRQERAERVARIRQERYV